MVGERQGGDGAADRKAETKKTVLGWREYSDPAFLTENTTRTAVYIDDSNSYVRGQYANMDTGLYISIGRFTDAAAAKTFFQRAGLL